MLKGLTSTFTMKKYENSTMTGVLKLRGVEKEIFSL